MNPELPADLFTACLTTPIKVALQWFCHQRQGSLSPDVTIDLIEKLVGILEYAFIQNTLTVGICKVARLLRIVLCVVVFY